MAHITLFYAFRIIYLKKSLHRFSYSHFRGRGHKTQEKMVEYIMMYLCCKVQDSHEKCCAFVIDEKDIYDLPSWKHRL